MELDDDDVEFYLVIAGLSDDAPAKEIPFGNGALVIEESGAFSDPPASVTADDFYTKPQSDSRYLLSADLSGKVNRAGDTMTGLLTLSAAPTTNLHAATKLYVDTADAALNAAKQAVVTGGATTILSSNLTVSRALVSDGSGKVAISAVTATELGYLSGVTSAVQTQLAAKQAAVTGGATTILSSNLTTGRALVSDGSGKVAVASVTTTELNYLSGVTSAVQTQLTAKQATITGGATTILSSDLTVSRALVSDGSGKVAISAVTATELGYLSGVTSAVQTQLNARLPLAGGTLTGAVAMSSGALTLSGAPTSNLHAATKLYVDTADALKADLAGATFSGALQFSGSSHAGLRVNRLTSTEITALGAPVDGFVVYDTTLSEFRFREAATWKSLGGVGAGTGWLSGTTAPDNGDGADGDYYLQDDGSIWLKTSGAWAVFVAARLPLSGGTLTGLLRLDELELRNQWQVTCDAGSYDFQIIRTGGGGTALAIDAATSDVSLMRNLQLSSGYGLKVNGVQVVGSQQGALGDHILFSGYSATSGGYGFASSILFAAFVAQCDDLAGRVNGILAKLRAHGLIGT